MVVLAASICTKGGKPILSRQFREMPRSRIEGLLTSFPKLIPANTQHTSVETADVRYVYQPLEELYILLITNKASNILQDIETLHLFARVVSDQCRTAEEREISKNAFALLGAFDEIISLGYREQVNSMQIKNVLEMESHEEKIQDIIARNKEAEAKEELKRRAKQLEMQRREMAKRNAATGGNASYLGGMSNTSGPYSSIPRFEAPTETIRSSSPAPSSLTTKSSAFKGSGMKLGKQTKQSDFLASLGHEVVTPDVSMPSTPVPQAEPTPVASSASKTVLPAVHQESVHVTTKEHLSVTLLQSGGLKSFELKGDLNLLISSPSATRVKLNLSSLPTSPAFDTKELQFKYHPNLARSGGAGLEKEIKLKDSGRNWPVGNPLGVLRWRAVSKDESFVPISINCWPTPSGDGTCDVNIEYELENEQLELHNLTISIPLPDGAYPTVSSHSGDWSLDPNTHSLLWKIPQVSHSADTQSGSLEFSVGGDDPSVFFPVKADFLGVGSIAGIEVTSVVQVDSGEDTVYSRESTVVVDEYAVV